MSQRVLCVMLADGRREMVERSIRSFLLQSYSDRQLLIFDSGDPPLSKFALGDGTVCQVRSTPDAPRSIGTLRNMANSLATTGALDCSLIAHWDSDDWSHPYRLAEQVEMLEGRDADCVGYRDMVFWDWRAGGYRVEGGVLHAQPRRGGEAWVFRSPNPAYILGTSMLYTRRIWERFNFKDRATAEDTLWLMEKRIRREATSSIDGKNELSVVQTDRRPRMVAALHDGNTCSTVKPGAAEWTRAAERDEFCRETMELI